MRSSGYVYALINPSMPKLVKVGRTSRTPVDRANELSGATGVPTPFVVVYHECFADAVDAEMQIHAALKEAGYRVSDSREFFDAEVADVIKTIAACPGKTLSLVAEGDEPETCTNIVESLLGRADACRYGTGDEFKDAKEAMRLYREAARLGSGRAWSSIGELLREEKGNLEPAFDAFKEAVRKGFYPGYKGMADIYQQMGDEESFKKCWMRYFEGRKISGVLYYPHELYDFFFWHGISGWIPTEIDDVLCENRVLIRDFSEKNITTRTSSGRIVVREDASPIFMNVHRMIITMLFDGKECELLHEYDDRMYKDAVNLVRRYGKASTSFIQTHLQIGYSAAADLIDRLERGGL